MIEDYMNHVYESCKDLKSNYSLGYLTQAEVDKNISLMKNAGVTIIKSRDLEEVCHEIEQDALERIKAVAGVDIKQKGLLCAILRSYKLSSSMVDVKYIAEELFKMHFAQGTVHDKMKALKWTCEFINKLNNSRLFLFTSDILTSKIKLFVVKSAKTQLTKAEILDVVDRVEKALVEKLGLNKIN